MVMARSMVFLVFTFVLISYMPSYEARKILSTPEKKDSFLLKDSSTQIVFQTEDQWSSIIQGGQAESTNEKLSTTLKFAESYRVLSSVPSPGIGHFQEDGLQSHKS